MSIELVIKVLTIVGSMLGAVAFFQNFTKEITSTNKEKWKKVSETITSIDFDNLQYQIVSRKIRGTLFRKLETFNYIIEKDNQDIIGFKSFFKNKIKAKLKELNSLFKHLREYVQVPFWNPYEDVDDEGNVAFGYIFDKNVFFEDKDNTWTNEDYVKATQEYNEHIANAQTIAEKMEKVFAEVQVLANKEPFELLLPWKWS